MNPDFADILSALSAAGVEFLIVGAHALAAHGVPRATGDLDIWVRPTPDNAARTLRALAAFGAPLSRFVGRGPHQAGHRFSDGPAAVAHRHPVGYHRREFRRRMGSPSDRSPGRRRGRGVVQSGLHRQQDGVGRPKISPTWRCSTRSTASIAEPRTGAAQRVLVRVGPARPPAPGAAITCSSGNPHNRCSSA